MGNEGIGCCSYIYWTETWEYDKIIGPNVNVGRHTSTPIFLKCHLNKKVGSVMFYREGCRLGKVVGCRL